MSGLLFRMRTQGVRWLVVLVLLLAASGCAVRLVYNQLDWAIPWYLNDYLALEGEQKDQFKRQLDDYLYWHRVDQLPQYASFLREVAVQAQNGLDRNEIAVIQSRTESFANTLIVQMTPHVVDLFASVSDQQVEQFYKALKKGNAEFRVEYIEISERAKRKQAANDARDYVERWVGGLSDKQDDIIRHWSQTYQPMGEEILQGRLAWQTRFREILALRKNQPAQYEQQMSALLIDRNFGRSESFNSKFEHNREALISLYQMLDASLSRDQRKRLIKQLNSYADDFVVLSKQVDKDKPVDKARQTDKALQMDDAMKIDDGSQAGRPRQADQAEQDSKKNG